MAVKNPNKNICVHSYTYGIVDLGYWMSDMLYHMVFDHVSSGHVALSYIAKYCVIVCHDQAFCYKL